MAATSSRRRTRALLEGPVATGGDLVLTDPLAERLRAHLEKLADRDDRRALPGVLVTSLRDHPERVQVPPRRTARVLTWLHPLEGSSQVKNPGVVRVSSARYLASDLV